MQEDRINADRFLGYASLYDSARPTVPEQACELLTEYLGHRPDTVIDLGCGTGLSTSVWQGRCRRVIGVEPSADMIAIAESKASEGLSFIQAFADATGLPDACADIVVCSQSFHWMEPQSTLAEVDRVLKKGGVFATVDCDWPPVCHWQAEKAYLALMQKVSELESENADVRRSFRRWEKSRHLANIQASGCFEYCREMLLAYREPCDTERFIAIALSQGGLQTVLKKCPQLIEEDLLVFEREVRRVLGKEPFTITFCYRMRVGIK